MFLLRWRYEWPDRPAKFGMWNQPGDLPVNQAWAQNKDGLAYAVIESKNIKTREIADVVRCPGHDFLNFQWIAAASVSGAGLVRGGFGSVVPRTKLVGIKMITRDESLAVYVSGQIVRAPLKPGEASTNFATFGK